MIPQVNLFSFIFLEEIDDTKKTFPNELTFSTVFVISKGHLKNLDTEPGLPILAPLKQRAKVTANNVIPSRAQKCDEAPMPATTITQYV